MYRTSIWCECANITHDNRIVFVRLGQDICGALLHTLYHFLQSNISYRSNNNRTQHQPIQVFDILSIKSSSRISFRVSTIVGQQILLASRMFSCWHNHILVRQTNQYLSSYLRDHNNSNNNRWAHTINVDLFISNTYFGDILWLTLHASVETHRHSRASEQTQARVCVYSKQLTMT